MSTTSASPETVVVAVAGTPLRTAGGSDGTLRIGDAGAAVTALQQALQDAGFPPGAIDGEFGAGTEAAVMAFQRSAGLLPDGVAGPRTLSVLAAGRSGMAEAAAAAPAIPAGDLTAMMTVQVAARMVPGAPLGNIKRHLPHVLDALRERALSDRRMVLMAIATIAAETAGFEPIDEFISRFNTSPGGPPFDLYDFRGDIGNGAKGDGALFKGRGFIQLTGRANYRSIGEELGIPLEREPQLANEPTAAARILAQFLKTKELRIKQALIEDDLRAARKAVNGGSHGLEPFTTAYRTGDMLLPA